MQQSRLRHTPQILFALAIALLPHIFNLRPWIICWCVAFWGYTYWIYRTDRRPPGKLVRSLYTLAGVTVILITNIRIGGDTFVGLMAVMAGIKPLEIETHRDRIITLFLAYFIVIARLFQSETLSITLYMFFSVCVTTAVLIKINHPAGRLKDQIKLSLKIMAQALPLMLILFFLFPRLPGQGSLWGSQRRQSAKTGFGDQVQPGDIGRLVQNDEVAFRVAFQDSLPARKDLYWRGLVFKTFTGRGWKRGHFTGGSPSEPEGGIQVAYEVTLMPHDRKWLFALDLPIEAPPGTRLLENHTLWTHRDISKTFQYHMVSVLNPATGFFERRVQANLQLPRDGNPLARDLADKWRRQGVSPGQIVELALEYFRDKPFVYSLQPPVLGRDSVDDFLFVTREGYCEHYASAFAFLMRAAGVPARLVGGYLGGAVNPYSGDMIVRQSDAHVWCEVWSADKGWVRVDPTAVIAPDRIRLGTFGVLSPDDLPFMMSFQRYGRFAAFLQKLSFGWDMIQAQWDIWLSEFSTEQQQALLARVGLRIRNWMATTLALIVFLGMGVGGFIFLFLYITHKADTAHDPVQAIYLAFCKKMAGAGLAPLAGQGPRAYEAAIMASRGDLKDQVSPIIDLYVRLRYSARGQHPDFVKFKRLVRRFRPK